MGRIAWISGIAARSEWILIALAAPLLLFPNPIRSVALLVVPILWAFRKIASGRFVECTPLNAPLALLLFTMLVSLYATFDIAYSVPKLAGMVLGVGVFYALVSSAKDWRSWALAAGAFLTGGLAVGTLGLIGTNWIHKFSVLEPVLALLPTRLTGLPGAAEGFHPNEVAGALLWITPLACALAVVAVLSVHSLAKSHGGLPVSILVIALTVSAAFMTGVLILTQSRGGWIAGGLVMPATVVLVLKGKLRRLATVFFGTAVLAAGVWAAVARPQALDLLIIGPEQDPARGMSLENLSVRAEIWSRAIYGIEDFPFTGMGMNTFRRVVHVLYPLFTIGPEFDIGHAHNEFLQAALDLGIPGLIAFLAVNFGAFAMLISTWRQRAKLPLSEPVNRALIIGLGGGLLAHLLYGLTDAIALGAKPGVLWWMLLGLIAGLYRLQESGIRDQEER